MLAEHITAALGIARGRSALDDVSRVIWKGMAEGLLSEEEAQRFADQLEALRRGEGVRENAPRRGAENFGPSRRHSIFPPRRKQVSPDRRISLARRRRLASSGPVPPSLAAHFTTSELAVLRIIGDEWRGEGASPGACLKTLAEIAARAGVSRTTVQNAIRQARTMGMLKVEERRVMGAKNLPNKITVVCAEWKTWLRRGPKSGPPREKSPHRVQKSEPHRYQNLSSEERRAGEGASLLKISPHNPLNQEREEPLRSKALRNSLQQGRGDRALQGTPMSA